VSAEVIDPHSQTTVYAESADGVGVGSTLDSIDDVTAVLRSKLGEAIRSIERDSTPLPQVSTSNLDALKAYALGNERRATGDDKEALGYYQRAAELDPQFALAILAAGQMHAKFGDLPGQRREFDRADKLRSHLTAYEALLLDANLASFGPLAPRLQRWRQMIDMYPDSHVAHFALAQLGMFYANQYAEGLPHARAASVTQSSRRAIAQYLHAMIFLGLERYPEAIGMFQASRKSGFKGAGFFYAHAYAAQRDYASAERVLAARPQTGAATAELEIPQSRLLFALDQGRWAEAETAVEQGAEAAHKAEPLIAAPAWRNRELATALLVGSVQPDILQARLVGEIDSIRKNAAQIDAIYPNYSEIFLLSAGYIGARLGSQAVVRNALEATSASTDIAGFPVLMDMRQVLLAEQDRLSGKAGAAVERLDGLVKADSASVPMHAALLRAARANGDGRTALREARWLAAHRGRAYVEEGVGALQAPFNVYDTVLARLEAAELLAETGDVSESRKELTAFLAAWPHQVLPDDLRRRATLLSR